MADPQTAQPLTHEQKRTVLDADDVMEMAPPLRGHRKLVEWLLQSLSARKSGATIPAHVGAVRSISTAAADKALYAWGMQTYQ